MANHDTAPNGPTAPDLAASLHLDARPERRLVRPTGSRRHVDLAVRVDPAAPRATARPPLTLALVLDRSGSMAGAKLATARQAAQAVVDRLDERDQAAVVIFDDHVEVLQPATAMTPAAKLRAHALLAGVESRGSTALHEGWLVGCQAIAPATPTPARLARCFLLTDGLANYGLTDPQEIARQAAGVRDHAGICTSTFGIGADYDEAMLGPLAVAGGGQFHHLRHPAEIARAFVGELEGLLAVAARGVRLELAAEAGVRAEVVSQYWASPADDAAPRWTVALGDLAAGEERHVVVRCGFPRGSAGASVPLRARLAWTTAAGEARTPWQEVRFTYADHAACDAEARDPSVMRWVGLHHAERAEREAVEHNRRGDYARAGKALSGVARRIAKYADGDQALEERVRELDALAPGVAAAPLPPLEAKERYAAAQRRSRGQVDRREP